MNPAHVEDARRLVRPRDLVGIPELLLIGGVGWVSVETVGVVEEWHDPHGAVAAPTVAVRRRAPIGSVGRVSPTRGLPDDAEARLRRSLAYDIRTEADSVHLYRWIATNVDAAPARRIAVPLLLWLADEQDHAAAFRVAWSARYADAPPAESTPDFDRLADVLSNLPGVLLALAFDEAATVVAYRRMMGLYRTAGIGDLLRRVIADEGRHLALFVYLFRLVAGDRSEDDVSAALDRLIRLDGHPYTGTFVLDHDPLADDCMNASLLAEARRIVLGALRLRTSLSGPSPGGA